MFQRVMVPIACVFITVILSACSSAGGSASAVTTPTVGVVATTAPAAASPIVATEAPSRCLGVQPNPDEKITPNGGGHWSAPDKVTVEGHTYCAILTTNHGRIVVELFSKTAPKNVNSFVFLAKNGYYENITWHRVIDGFMAQSGDPTGTGGGSPGYQVPLETVPGLLYDREGRVGAARTDVPDSAGSQFFITFGPSPNLDPSSATAGYTILGQVVEGLNVLRQITIRNVDQNPNLPKGDPLVSVRIVDVDAAK